MDKKPCAFRLIVTGRVQGVGFRYSTTRTAVRTGVFGWVRNRPDGSVEIHCEGDSDQIGRFLRWLEKGPPGSYVERVEKRTVPLQNTYRSFTIDY